MGNQAISEAGTPSVIASSAIIKKHDQLRMKLGFLRFIQKSMKPLPGIIALACKQRENYSN
ncbi:MAG: hypothetical protein QNJ41_08325 [Xenococcaceae cyanobacterium MO_188.B32]|nr:hypothetical protein [Xenococcaceae cyanobacterium MO_188.B32]